MQGGPSGLALSPTIDLVTEIASERVEVGHRIDPWIRSQLVPSGDKDGDRCDEGLAIHVSPADRRRPTCGAVMPQPPAQRSRPKQQANP